MRKLISLLAFCFLLIAGCSNMQPISEQALGGIQPSGGGGQIFPPRNNLPMGTFLFTNEGQATANNEPCTYGQSSCKTEITNNSYVVASLPAGKPVGTQELVTDWNGTAGTCVGGGSTASLAVYNGSAWICFGGSGSSVQGINVNIASFCSGSGTTAGTYACYETMTGSAQKAGLCLLNGYRNASANAQTCNWPTPFVSAVQVGPGNSVPPTSTTIAIISFPANMGTATETAVVPFLGL